MQEPIYIYNADTIQKQIKNAKEKGYGRLYAFPHALKDRFECCAWILQGMLDVSNMGEKLGGIDEKLVIEIKQLLSSLNYLLNYTSYKDKKYYEFDKQEVNRKLRRKSNNV